MKTKLFILSLLIIPSILLQAYSSMDDRVSKLEKEMQEVGKTNALGNFGTSFTTGRREGGNGVFIIVDPLYWHAKVGETEYAYTEEFAGTPQNLLFPPHHGALKHNDFGWDWGVRVGLGYNLCRDMWDINLNYTWFDTNSSDSTQKNPPSAIRPSRFIVARFASNAKSSFSIGYNNINLELGRHFFISKMISAHPFIGLKSTWLDLKQRIFYQPTTPGIGDVGGLFKLNDKSNLWGIGPRGGFNSKWYLGDGFSITGMLATALLYCDDSSIIHMKADANTTDIGNDLSVKLKGNKHLFVPTVQMFLGLIWEKSFFNETKHITLGLGYEVEYYWRANQMMVQEDTSNPNAARIPNRVFVNSVSEDVMFYGITGKIRFDF